MDRKPDIHGLIGLTSREAERILGEEGPNELPSSKQRGNLRIALDVMREPMFLLLVACGAIYLVVGDMQEALMLLAFVFFVITMTNRSWTSTIGKIHRAPNAALWWVTGGTVVFLGLVLTIPFLREIFRFSVIHPVDVVICVSAGLLSVVWFELFKLFTRKSG
jgi:Ca2+-transporting ATPase